MPRPEAIDAGSCADRVSRVPKLTSFSIFARTCSAETCCRAAAIFGSAEYRSESSAHRCTAKAAIHRVSASVRGVIEDFDAILWLGILVQGRPAGRAGDSGFPVRRGPEPKNGRT